MNDMNNAQCRNLRSRTTDMNNAPIRQLSVHHANCMYAHNYAARIPNDSVIVRDIFSKTFTHNTRQRLSNRRELNRCKQNFDSVISAVSVTVRAFRKQRVYYFD